MNSLWLIIWRFQPLHLGHQLLIEATLQENSSSLILIGSINKTDSQNPYSYDLRKQLIEEIYEEQISIWALPDFPSDVQWKNYILSYIPKETKHITLYCGDIKNDSAVISLLSLQSTLPFKIKVQEIPRSIIPVSATQVRKWIQEKNTSQLQKYLWEKTLLFLGLEL